MTTGKLVSEPAIRRFARWLSGVRQCGTWLSATLHRTVRSSRTISLTTQLSKDNWISCKR